MQEEILQQIMLMFPAKAAVISKRYEAAWQDDSMSKLIRGRVRDKCCK